MRPNRIRRNCAPHTERSDYTSTPQPRYLVVRGRLGRFSSPWPNPAIYAPLVQELVAARRAVRDFPDSRRPFFDVIDAEINDRES